jgi:hypothetical protein
VLQFDSDVDIAEHRLVGQIAAEDDDALHAVEPVAVGVHPAHAVEEALQHLLRLASRDALADEGLAEPRAFGRAFVAFTTARVLRALNPAPTLELGEEPFRERVVARLSLQIVARPDPAEPAQEVAHALRGLPPDGALRIDEHAFRAAGLDSPARSGPSTGIAIIKVPARPFLGPVFDKDGADADVVSKRFLERVVKNLGGCTGQ